MFNDTILKIAGSALLLVVVTVILVHFWPVVVAVLALIGLAVLIKSASGFF